MELWIRGQDKTYLLKIDNINMDDDDYSLYYQLSYAQVRLGEYKTKERALEVLDDIEDKLINCTFAQKQNGLGEVLDFMPNSIYVYTMPKE